MFLSPTELGASELLDRDTLQGEPRPLGKELYAGCVDSAGGHVLSNILPLIKHSGAVAAAPDTNTPGGSYYYHW